MKKIFRYSALAALLVSFAAFTGCKQEALDTDQYGDGVKFSAFAPNPAMRGGELRILGSNLQDVKEIRLQGGVSVTDYTVVTSGRESEIRFTVPVEGPEPGKISIVDRDGVEYSSFSDLTFTEAIEIDSFSPAEVLSSDVITITGEYLNIVKEVVFEGGVYVTEFESQSRHELKVKVPAEAISGYFRVSDVNEVEDQTTIPNTVYAPTELKVGDPVINFKNQGPYKLGDVIKIDGEHLDMIKTINLEGASDVEFYADDDAVMIALDLPATATDGDMVLYSYEGKAFVAGKIETVSVADLGIKSLAEDGRYKAGTEVEISGSDLDLVSKLAFTNAEASFTYKDGKITATIPAAAKDGAITVTLESGKQSQTPEIEVVKPVITSLSATEAVAGKTELEIYGTDLDLATVVKIGNETESFIECAYEVKDNGTLKVKVADQAYTGPFTVVAENGYQTVSEDVTITYDNAVSIKFTKPSYSVGRDISIEGSNLQKIETISIKGKKVTSFTSRSNDAMAFGVPDGLGPGVYRLVLGLVDGTELTWPVPFELTAPYTETYIWEGSEDLAGWGNSPYLGTPNAFQDAGIAEGDVIRVYFTKYNDWWQFKTYAGHWGDTFKFAELDGGDTVNPNNCDTSAGYFAFNVTADILSQLCNQDTGWGGAFQCQGEGIIITGVSLIHYGATEKVVWEGSEYTGANYNNNLCLGTEDDWVNAGLEDGCEVKLYFTAESETDWQIQVFDGHWTAMSALNLDGDNHNQFNAQNSPEAFSKGYVSFKATGAIYTALTSKAGWGNAIILQGKGITFTKISFM
jgi:hypothetical protein